MSAKISGAVRDRYLELVRKFPLSPVKNEKDHQAAQRVMDGILAKGRLSKGELAYLDTLSELVLAYENVHHPIPAPSDAAMLQHFMDAKGVTQTQLHQATKSPSRQSQRFCRASGVSPEEQSARSPNTSTSIRACLRRTFSDDGEAVGSS